MRFATKRSLTAFVAKPNSFFCFLTKKLLVESTFCGFVVREVGLEIEIYFIYLLFLLMMDFEMYSLAFFINFFMFLSFIKSLILPTLNLFFSISR